MNIGSLRILDLDMVGQKFVQDLRPVKPKEQRPADGFGVGDEATNYSWKGQRVSVTRRLFLAILHRLYLYQLKELHSERETKL